MDQRANIINVDLANSATKKNESLLDTMHTLKAMQIDMFDSFFLVAELAKSTLIINI
jgi:aspartate carbamoyltransferase catalytic subunit